MQPADDAAQKSSAPALGVDEEALEHLSQQEVETASFDFLFSTRDHPDARTREKDVRSPGSSPELSGNQRSKKRQGIGSKDKTPNGSKPSTPKGIGSRHGPIHEDVPEDRRKGERERQRQ